MNQQHCFLGFLSVVLAGYLLGGCGGRDPEPADPCAGRQEPGAYFGMFEVMYDTAFPTDTTFTHRTVVFRSLAPYDEVEWQVGNDHRVFTDPAFGLSFGDFPDTQHLIRFRAKRNQPDTLCFPDDPGQYEGERTLTILNGLAGNDNRVKPRVEASYRIAPVDDPSDTFRINIAFFDSLKYRPYFGKNPIYQLENMPKGYRDTLGDIGRIYPELSYGQRIGIGYTCFLYYWPTEGVGWIRGDSVYIRERESSYDNPDGIFRLRYTGIRLP
jgi:hypothetical protein